jgi:hypothetical protein
MSLNDWLPAIASAAASLAGIFGANKLTNYRIEQLEKKVSAHNSLIDRTYEAEKNIELNRKEIDRHKERLRILEGD